MSATKPRSNPLNGVHTAGIFADMTVDGPEIGTLVLIADRAKNLPNRKTIGKQDPYCAARLGKEAQKTKTDIRGGQTPRWDQELRFLVRDSPDYFQLKLSVFNDDKRTELIGEAWIDLRDIIVSGGGQKDQWQNLSFKGKYAGEIRIELTFYDSRPKPEKPIAKSKPVALGPDGTAPVKRRPLPSSPGGIEAPPLRKSTSDPVQTASRLQSNPHGGSYIPNKSPLQAVEHMAPPTPSASSNGSQYGSSSHRTDAAYVGTSNRGERQASYEETYSTQPETYSQPREFDNQVYHGEQAMYDPASSPYAQPEDDRPPPPPAHGSRANSANSHIMTQRASFDSQQPRTGGSPMPMRHDVLRSEAHRQSLPGPASSPASHYPGKTSYRPYDANGGRRESYNEDPYQHQAQDYPEHPGHSVSPRSLQPTVEDVPESWTPPHARSKGSFSRPGQYDDVGYNPASSPAPLNLGGRASAASGHYSTSPVHGHNQYSAHDYNSPSPASARDHAQSSPARGYTGMNSRDSDGYTSRRDEVSYGQSHSPGQHDFAPVPATLVPGVDPSLSMEIATRFREERGQERRYTQPAAMTTPTRGRQYSEPPETYGNQPRGYGGNQAPYSSGPSTPDLGPRTQSRAHSPNPSGNYVIKRKSVSPSPLDNRRLSSAPFGPDDYDALNPSIASSREPERQDSEYTNAYGKIITHDGREIDPSDHLPMDTWAPEPESKQPKTRAPEPSQTRPTLAGAQPMPPSGRRVMRVSARPQSMAATPTTYAAHDIDLAGSTGRNRLQKKTHHNSAMPTPISSGSSPLGPATSHQRNSTPPRALVRASTYDYENHGSYNSHSSGARDGYGGGPPIPAKIPEGPMMSGGAGPGPSPGHASGGRPGGEEWALMEEMSRIDIGSGRARRHGGY